MNSISHLWCRPFVIFIRCWVEENILNQCISPCIWTQNFKIYVWNSFKWTMFYVYMQSSWMNKKWIVAPILAYENRILLEVQSANVLSLKDDFSFSLKIWTFKFLEKYYLFANLLVFFSTWRTLDQGLRQFPILNWFCLWFLFWGYIS